MQLSPCVALPQVQTRETICDQCTFGANRRNTKAFIAGMRFVAGRPAGLGRDSRRAALHSSSVLVLSARWTASRYVSLGCRGPFVSGMSSQCRSSFNLLGSVPSLSISLYRWSTKISSASSPFGSLRSCSSKSITCGTNGAFLVVIGRFSVGNGLQSGLAQMQIVVAAVGNSKDQMAFRTEE
jgi:hypothetical protein